MLSLYVASLFLAFVSVEENEGTVQEIVVSARSSEQTRHSGCLVRVAAERRLPRASVRPAGRLGSLWAQTFRGNVITRE
ncbi:hypothetical protein E2C01_023549 [Portunus trituberculatus]|uniref:Secreted protein n=1 Tax=Portunus trituberculatus TaxID=210409 RepID=A0A5B7EAA1_PORTR|nr:hypothetical protein [Portunus trituberculatus]